jgi:hypothetical protein
MGSAVSAGPVSYPTYPAYPAYPTHPAYPTYPAYPTHPTHPTHPTIRPTIFQRQCPWPGSSSATSPAP